MVVTAGASAPLGCTINPLSLKSQEAFAYIRLDEMAPHWHFTYSTVMVPMHVHRFATYGQPAEFALIIHQSIIHHACKATRSAVAASPM